MRTTGSESFGRESPDLLRLRAGGQYRLRDDATCVPFLSLSLLIPRHPPPRSYAH